MRLYSNVLSMRRFLSRGAVGAVVAAAIFQAAATSQARAQTVNPLDYVPASSGVFVHVRVNDIWNAPLIAEIRKAIGKDLDKLLSDAENEIGIRPDIVDTATFFYPDFPMGSGDEETFIGIVVTNKPFDKSTVLKNVRKKDAKDTDGRIPLTEKLFLTFLDDRTFAVAHETHFGKNKKLQIADRKPGVMSEALKLAREKNQAVFSMDFSKLPNEIFTNTPAELRPFLPLLKTKSSILVGNLIEKELKFRLHFTSDNDESSEDADRSFKLLMKLASDGLAQVLKNEQYLKEIGPLLVGLKEIERAVNNVKQKRDGVRLDIAMDIKADMPVGEIVSKTMKKIREETARAGATNNLKQVALAMHNYHDANNGFPASAICDKKGKPLLSWRVAILPYIEQQNLYMEFKLDEPWDSENNKKLIAKMPKTYALPNAKSTDGKTHYQVFTGNGAVFDLIQLSKITEITDGTSNTAMIVETAEPVVWSKPDDIEYDEKLMIEKLLRFVDGKTAIAYCDGSVRMIKKGIGDKVWHWIIQKNDGNIIPDIDNSPKPDSKD